MKKVLFTYLVMALIIGGCAREKKSPIDGIWKLTYGKWYNWNPSDTITYQFPVIWQFIISKYIQRKL